LAGIGASSSLKKTALVLSGATSGLLSDTEVTNRAACPTLVISPFCHQRPIFGRAVSGRPVA
jgi:hypothetical protein